MDILIVIFGNDGTGKTTLCRLINQQFKQSKIAAIERSHPNDELQAIGIDPALKEKVGISFFDDMTLDYTFARDPNDSSLQPCESVEIDGKQVAVHWICLDCEPKVIEDRIKDREVKEIWDQPKSVEYFRPRFRELAAFYGIPIIDTTTLNIKQVLKQIALNAHPDIYRIWRSTALKDLTYDVIKSRDIEELLTEQIMDSPDQFREYFDNLGNFGLYDILFEKEDKELDEILKSDQNKARLLARFIVNNGFEVNNDKIMFIWDKMIIFMDIDPTVTYFKLRIEGESKKVYDIVTPTKVKTGLDTQVAIILKSTIYSHSKQATGEIENLGSIRAYGTRFFQEMMARNGLRHTYRSINEHGIIISDRLDNIPFTEIVIKKYCEGTDKHSYYQVRDNRDVVLETGEYVSGPYVRFDFRNPNHLCNRTGKCVNENLYYYLVEEMFGKERFFQVYLSFEATGPNGPKAKPFGDKTVPQDLLPKVINVEQTKKSVLKMFFTIQSYFRQVGLEIQDVCFMLDKSGTTFWSEINQDCMRIKALDGSEQYDKDIWRAGGSATKELLVQKWNIFNEMFRKFFMEKDNYFKNKEMLMYNSYPYQAEVRRVVDDDRLTISPEYSDMYQSMVFKERRRVIVTMDLYDGKPVLVKSGKVFETHSEGDIVRAFNNISIFPDILVVDLNGAIDYEKDGSTSKNREIIKQLATQFYIHSGGGLRTIEDVQDVLESSARRIVVSSNTDDEFIKQIPKDRLIVELSVDEEDNVLIKGRKENTKIKVGDQMQRLATLGVEAFSITFHQTEGHLNGIPREQISRIMLGVPKSVEKVIIAGGISTVDDLEFLWSFDKVIPQLGSAIWKDKLSVGDIYNAMTRTIFYNVPTIIQDVHGRVKGQVYLNRESIDKTCETRMLHRYSRKLGRVIMKGETSGDVQRVVKISHDCDNDALLVTVSGEKPFCHTGNYSCFSLQTAVKANLGTLADYIRSRKDGTSYSAKMQQNPGLALAKLMEEFWEIVTASDKTRVEECSDFLVHYIMYLNGMGVDLYAILNELNARKWNPHLNQLFKIKDESSENEVIIAITPSKYAYKTDKFAEEQLGVVIDRGSDRNLKINYKVVDEKKYQEFFGDKKLVFVTSRPKDMPFLIAFKRIDGALTYNTVVKNSPKVYKKILEVADETIILALIKRKGETIDPSTWTADNKVLIATEHVYHVHNHFVQRGLDEHVFSLDRVIGSSEGYMVNNTKDKYLLCDAIVESGRTLEENGLEVWETVLPKGKVMVGLYMNFGYDLDQV